jgi:hypothetical protein
VNTDMNPAVDPSASRTGGRHPVNVSHLVMGVAFAGIVTVWALVQADLVVGDDIRWLLPLPWVLAGAAGLVAWALSLRRRPAEAYDDHPDDYSDDHTAEPSFPSPFDPIDPTHTNDPKDHR